MTLVLLRALTTRRRVVVDVLIWGLVWVLAPTVEFRIPPMTYGAGVAAASLVSSGLLVNAAFRVESMRDYAQLPPRPARVNLALASAAWILLVAEVVMPAALFGLRLGQLAAPDVCAMLVVAACGPIAWVAFVAPTVTRWFVPAAGEVFRLAVTAIIGAGVSVGADIAARELFKPFETPLGAWTALIGFCVAMVFVARRPDR